MNKTFIFLLTLSLCLAKSTTPKTNTIRKHITKGLDDLINKTALTNFPSPVNRSICKQNLTCNNASQFFEDFIKYLETIKVDESNQNATRTLKILMGNVKELINHFRKGHTMTGENYPSKLGCKYPSVKSYYKSLEYLNRRCSDVNV